MTDYERNADVSKTLTDKWKKGELPEGHYYVKDGENIIAELLDGYFYNDGQPMTSFSGGVDEVLEPVPSYEKWQEYKDTNDSMFDTIKMLNKDNYKLEKENSRLKELLKLVARNREDLDGTLTDKQKETLEKFEECMNEMHSITERDAFSYGFRLGVQLMAEAFLLPIGEDE